MTQTVDDALRSATLYSDEIAYVMLSLPPAGIMAAAGVLAEVGEPFMAMIVDKDEVTLVLTEAEATEFSRRLPGARKSEAHYRLITFDIELEPTLVGFMASVSAILAEAGVTLMPFAAFARDHLLVPVAQYEQAIAALRTAQR